jgi:hypothetical protein
MLTRSLLITSLVVSVGCSQAGPSSMGPMPGGQADPNQAAPSTNNPDSPGSPGTPTTPPAAPKASYTGVYRVLAPLDFTQNGVLPGALGPALAGLSELHDHPGDAIIKIVQGANIPYLSDILNKVPGFLVSALSGLLDQVITNAVYNNYPAIDEIASVIQGITELANHLDVQEDLTVHTPAADGSVKIDQDISGVQFTLLGNQTMVALKAAMKTSTTGKLTPHPDAPIADADLSIDPSTVSLPIGELLLDAAGPLLFSQFGATDLTGALQAVVPCSSIGQDVSDGLGGIISASEVSQLCDGALGLIAGLAEQKIKAVTFDGIQVHDGKAVLFDVTPQKPTVDYRSDQLGNGTWTWKITVAGGSVDVPSTLAGLRVADAN